MQFGYGLNYLIDIDNAVIVDVDATPARTYDEVAATKTMHNRPEACFDLKPKRLAADTAYGTGKFLGWLVKEKQIARWRHSHGPQWSSVTWFRRHSYHPQFLGKRTPCRGGCEDRS